MKVLVIGSRIPFPLHDGGAIATYNMLKGLSLNGVELTYISLNTAKHFVDNQIINKEFAFLKKIIAFDIDTRIRITKAICNLFSKSSYNIDRFYDKNFENLLVKEIQSNSYDIIQFEGLFVAKYIDRIKKLCHTPNILRQHNVEFRIWERLAENDKNPLKKWYLNLLARRIRTFEKNIAGHFDQIVTIATSDEDQIKKWEVVKAVTTIPTGFEIPSPSREHTITVIKDSLYHIGSMEWMPNQQAMAWFYEEVWPLIIKQVPSAQFYMAGKNMPESYSKWASDNFHVLGEVQDITRFSEDKQILIVPLLSASGIRIKTIEAMMMGKAVVTTIVGATGLPVEHLQSCMIAENASDFADAVIYLLQNPAERTRIEANGKATIIANYEFHSVARQWISNYQSLLRH